MSITQAGTERHVVKDAVLPMYQAWEQSGACRIILDADQPGWSSRVTIVRSERADTGACLMVWSWREAIIKVNGVKHRSHQLRFVFSLFLGVDDSLPSAWEHAHAASLVADLVLDAFEIWLLEGKPISFAYVM